MSKAQAESVIKNIIREIVQECASRGQAVSETLVAFMVKAVVLDPSNEFSTEKTLTKDDVQKLIKICVDRLLDAHSPSLETIKMQVFFDMNYTSRKDFLDEHRRVMESRLQPVVREITDSRARTREELESLYRKIVSAVLLRSGLGSPTDINVVREATAALQSVFPQSELGTFLGMSKRDKERHLIELTGIVTGIRLFNKDSGKGGEGIDDLPSFLNEGIPITTTNLNQDIARTTETINKYTTMIEKFTVDLEKPSTAVNVPATLNMELLRQSVINCRQHEAFLRVILNDIIRSAEQVEKLIRELATRMEYLHSTVQSKTAVPTAQVYPQFVLLSDIWCGFQDEMVLLSVLTNILNNLDSFTQAHRELFTEDWLTTHLEKVQVKTDKSRVEEHANIKVNPARTPDKTWLFQESTNNFETLPLQFKGFCPWSLVRYDRLMLPGNPKMGVLFYKENYYAFSTLYGAYEFADNPDLFLRAIAEAARKSPELIQLLEMHQQFSAITPYSQSKEKSAKMIERPVTKADCGSQTDTHFMSSNIVKSYEWNEWELRRKALKLANLRQKATHSVQTNVSNCRRDNYSQVYLPKEQTSQTVRDNYSDVPKPSVFYAGLRGGGFSRPTVVTKVDLTIPIQQQFLGDINGKQSTIYPAP